MKFMAEEIVEKKENSPFWSPWTSLLVGTLFAYLNWWRMNKKKKAIYFLFINIFINWITSWVNFKGGTTSADYKLSIPIFFTSFIITITFIGILALITSSDIRLFEKEAQEPASVKWQIIFVFWAILISSNLGIWAGLDYIARDTGLCHFPRFRDVMYQQEITQRTGLATLVLRQTDFSCDWVWDIESLEPTTPNGIWLHLINETNSMDEPMLTASERIYQYKKVTQDEFSKITNKASKLNYSEYPVEIKDPNAQFSNIHCAKSNKFTFCNLYFGYQTIITGTELTFSGFTDEQINTLIRLIVSTNSQRIQAYEEK